MEQQTSSSQKNTWVILGVCLFLFALGVWYVVSQKSDNTLSDIGLPRGISGYFVLDTITRDDLPEEKLAQYQSRMLQAREAVIASAPDYFDFEGFMQAAAIKKGVGDYKGAEEIWKYVNTMRPKNSVSFANLGDLYVNFLNRPEEAEVLLRTAVENEPENPTILRNLLELYQFHLPAKIAEVGDVFRTAKTAHANRPEFYLILAQYYEAAADMQGARAVWQEMKTTFPDDPTTQALVKSQIERLGNGQ